MTLALRALLVALAVGNIGLTVWHWWILRRARRYGAWTGERLAEVGRLLDEVRRVHGPVAGVASNGHRPAVEPEGAPGKGEE